jgi:hypothetical protein
MRSHVLRWLLGAALALMVAVNLAFGGDRPASTVGAAPTPTQAAGTNSEPGGSGGGGG